MEIPWSDGSLFEPCLEDCQYLERESPESSQESAEWEGGGENKIQEPYAGPPDFDYLPEINLPH